MIKLALTCSIALLAVRPASANQGCIMFSTTTVTTTVCNQFECNQRVNGECVFWACTNSQTSTYIDPGSTGCTRLANCGKKAVFQPGAPSADLETESNEVCDWYPCVQADPITKLCTTYMCVSKRIFQTVHTSYPNAVCVPADAQDPAPQTKAEPRKQQKAVLRRI